MSAPQRTWEQATCTEPLATGMPGDVCPVCGWVVPDFPVKKRTNREGVRDV